MSYPGHSLLVSYIDAVDVFYSPSRLGLLNFLIYKSVILSVRHENETQFFLSSGRVDTAIWMHYMDAN